VINLAPALLKNSPDLQLSQPEALRWLGFDEIVDAPVPEGMFLHVAASGLISLD
jgi:hypothetical protein